MTTSALRGRDWVFDLDNTLYPAETTIYDIIGERMTAYVARALGLDHVNAERERDRLFLMHGATATGLAAEHNVDAADFIAYVHDTDLSIVPPDEELNALIALLPGRKFVFTNGGTDYAKRMIAQLGLAAHMDGIVDLEVNGMIPKPDRRAYERLIALCALEPSRAVLVEDTLRNLETAHELGFATALVGHVHPEPHPAYLDHHAPTLKALLLDVFRTETPTASSHSPELG